MRAVAQVLRRAVAGEFYRHYAGWLIVAGLLLGGVLSNTEHVTLIREAIRDWRVLVGGYLLPWTLYALLSARFALRLWAEPAYETLLVLRVVPAGRRWRAGLLTQALILAPCWGYGVVIAVFAARAGSLGTLVLTVGWLLLLTGTGWLAHEAALRRAGAGGWLAGALGNRRLGRWPPTLWDLRAQLDAQPLATLALKAISVAVIWGICRVYSPATFDARVLTLGALLTAALYARLPAELYAWERRHLALRWNLPISPGQRWLQQALLLGALLLPELVAWARWGPLPAPARWGWALRLTLFPVAALLLAGAVLLRWPRRPADFLGRALAVAFGVYLLLLARVPLDLLTAAAGLGSFWLTWRYYWRADDPPADPRDIS